MNSENQKKLLTWKQQKQERKKQNKLIAEYNKHQKKLNEEKKKEDEQKKIRAKKAFNFLVDTNIIHKFVDNQNPVENKDVIENLKKEASKRRANTLLVLDRVLDETKNMEKDKFEQEYSYDEILEKLKEHFQVVLAPFKKGSDREKKANMLYKSTPSTTCSRCGGSKKVSNFECSKCKGTGKIGLSLVDCALLVTAQEQDWILVTRDGYLKERAVIEGKPPNKPLTTYDPFANEYKPPLVIN